LIKINADLNVSSGGFIALSKL